MKLEYIKWPVECFSPNLPTETMEVSCRRRRTKFTEEQLKILINAFNQKPYPSSAARRQLALKVNTEESRIQVSY